MQHNLDFTLFTFSIQPINENYSSWVANHLIDIAFLNPNLKLKVNIKDSLVDFNFTTIVYFKQY